jgi:MFS superfamily sulfate permease-like transporter
VIWKTAIAKSWQLRRRHIVGAAIVAAIGGIFTVFQRGIVLGLLFGAALAIVTFIINVAEDARWQRKEARKEASRVSD